MSDSLSPLTGDRLRQQVRQTIESTPVLDIHTHLYPPQFGRLYLAGIDELVTYHYLIAEVLRSSPTRPEQFWALTKQQQADLIWKTLFVENTPISEACRGVVNVMTAFGLDPHAPTLREAREFFAARNPEDHIRQVLEMANVSEVVMTNDAFDDEEAALWERAVEQNPQFHAVLRLDPLLNAWDTTWEKLKARGYDVRAELDDQTLSSVRRFLADWIARMKPLYAAVSLPPTFRYPEESTRAKLIAQALLPTLREHDLPFAMMIGVRKRVHPALQDAGDSLGHADIATVERLCLDFNDNRFLVTMLSRENQHELCVAARKFANLMPFGCWWFLNNPSIITEITNERIELIGTSFIPQHSDARILEQVIYKWAHSRRIIANVLAENYEALALDGWQVTADQIQRDVTRLFQGNFRQFARMQPYQAPEAVTV